MTDELLERTMTGGGILDRAGGLTTYTDSLRREIPCRMACCPGATDEDEPYCSVCRRIWPDLKGKR